MDRPDPDELRRMRDSLIAQIERDYDGVSRAGGVSMSEAFAIIDCKPAEKRAEARASDTDNHWAEVDVKWADYWAEALWRMDPIGFRYHLPAYLVFHLRTGYPEIPGSAYDASAHNSIFYRLRLNEETRELFSLLDAPQLRCLSRVFVFRAMAAQFQVDRDDAVDRLRDSWLQFLPSGEQRKLQARWPELTN